MRKRYVIPEGARDAREQGRIVLAHGELTGHRHEVLLVNDAVPDLEAAQYFEEPDGRRVLLVLAPCALRHAERAPIALDPGHPVPWRQGDVYGHPIGAGAWEIRRQRECESGLVRRVED